MHRSKVRTDRSPVGRPSGTASPCWPCWRREERRFQALVDRMRDRNEELRRRDFEREA